MALETRALLDLMAAAETTPALREAIRESTQTAERTLAQRISAWSPEAKDNYERAQLVISLLDGLAIRAIVNPINDALANRTRDTILAIITE
jgi:hypothetical protein